jgi:hypothetical protein
MSQKITVIAAAHYGETEARLAKQPIVIAMARELAGVPREQLVHVDEDGDEGGARFEFMQRANAEYRERGGKDGGHIGAVANALLKVLDAPKAELPKRSAESELASVRLFAQALVARGKTLQDAAMKEFDETGQSGYNEGHAAGFAAAARLALDFIENNGT